MAVSPTVLSIGSVTIQATGGHTGDVLNSILSAVSASTTVGATSSESTLPSPPATAGTYTLVIPSGYSGSLAIPIGYTYVLYPGSGTITGGDSNTTVLGDNLNYSGAAGNVVATGSTGGSVTSTGNGAVLSFFTGDYSVNASGGSDTVVVDTGATGSVTATGSNDVIEIGTPPTNIATGAAAIQAAGASPSFTANADGTGGIVYDYAGGFLVNLADSNEFVSNSGSLSVSTVVGTGGADTVFATSALIYTGTSAASSLFLGSNTGVVTVTSAAKETVFGGAGGGIYTEGSDSTGSFFFWGRHAGATPATSTSDTITGSATSPIAGQIWGASDENTVFSQSGTQLAIGAGKVFVNYGDSSTINATGSRGGDTFISWNFGYSADPTTNGNFTGNTTLVGSSQGDELFSVFDSIFSGLTHGPAHTITIENWVSSDVLALGGYNYSGSSNDLTTANTALSGGGGKSVSFTLSDGTTITFDTTSPTKVFHS
jgi:hypothetical protein